MTFHIIFWPALLVLGIYLSYSEFNAKIKRADTDYALYVRKIKIFVGGLFIGASVPAIAFLIFSFIKYII